MILRLVNPEIFTSGTFVLFPIKFLLYDDGILSDKANSASCDPIFAKLSLLKRSHWDDLDGSKIVFLRVVGYELSVFDISDINFLCNLTFINII
jgi:hypothetical protein